MLDKNCKTPTANKSTASNYSLNMLQIRVDAVHADNNGESRFAADIEREFPWFSYFSVFSSMEKG